MHEYPPTPIIAVVGSQRSGKTTTVETIVKQLTTKGYKVATAKHIPDPNFTIDTKNKDTWKHTQAGAHTVTSVAAREIAIIKKTDTTKYTIREITRNLENNTDIIILEGFRGLVAQDQTIPKIVTAKNKNETKEATKVFKPILAFTGTVSKTRTDMNELKIPIIDIRKQPQQLISIVEKRVAPIIQKRQELKETVTIHINGKTLPLNPYVQRVTRNVLFAIVSTLKGATVKGNENISIEIEAAERQ